MSKWSAVNTADDLADRIDMTRSCCLEGYTDDCMPKRILASWAFQDTETEDSRLVLFETRFGTFGVYEDSEDYTGHG